MPCTWRLPFVLWAYHKLAWGDCICKCGSLNGRLPKFGHLSQCGRVTLHVCHITHVWRDSRVDSYVWHDLHVCANCLWGGYISRLLRLVGLFCKRALYKRLYSAKETCNLKKSTNRSHPIAPCCADCEANSPSIWVMSHTCDVTHA